MIEGQEETGRSGYLMGSGRDENTSAQDARIDQHLDRVMAPGAIPRQAPARNEITGYNISASMSSDLENRFAYHSPKPDQLPRYAQLRSLARELAVQIVTLTPYSREQSLALTKLEESIFFANAAIARHET